MRNDAGQTYVWTIEGGKLTRRIVLTGRRDDASGRVEIMTVLPPDVPVLAARYDNLKEGLPARRRRRPRRRPRATRSAEERPVMWITRTSINNPVFATMVMVGITVLGLFSYARLDVEQMPDVSAAVSCWS